MFYYHLIYLDGIPVAEAEIRIDPQIGWNSDSLVLDLYAYDVYGAEFPVHDKDLENEIRAAHEDELWSLAYEMEQAA